MKKILIQLVAVALITMIHFSGWAQPPVRQETSNQTLRVQRDVIVPKQETISNIPDCFCCGDAYQMTAPVISGPDVVKCGTTATFTWPYNCTGVLVGRTFSPLPGVGWGDNNSASINIPAGYSGMITLTVSFNCGNKNVVGKKVFRVECCDCKALPSTVPIVGPRAICIADDCKDDLVYTLPVRDTGKCYTYSWKITPTVPTTIAGQGTNTIRIKCRDLKVGTYTISGEVKCGDKVVSSTAPITVCQKPNPNFAVNGSPTNPTNGVVTAGFPSSAHYWFIVNDVNGNGLYEPPTETFVGPLTGTSTNFSNLIVSRQYLFYHFVVNNCNGFSCWSGKVIRYAVDASNRVNPGTTDPNGKIQQRKVDEKTIQRLEELPKELLNKLPAELLESIKKSEYQGHVTLLK